MIFDMDSGKYLARNAVTAVAPWTRMRGMIGRKFHDFDAMVFPRCNAIHTFFMGEAIDVLFLSSDGKVLRCCESLPPWILCVRAKHGHTVVELPEGAIRAGGTCVGHTVNVNRNTVQKTARSGAFPQNCCEPDVCKMKGNDPL